MHDPNGAQPRELPDLSRAYRALAAGDVVVVPNPAPMAHGLVATDAAAVNAVKRRPADQPVGVSLHDRSQWEAVAPTIDLAPAAVFSVAALLRRRFTLLMPLRVHAELPDWVVPATRDGYLAAFNGYWSATAGLWERYPRLYGSSANLTGEPPLTSAAEARSTFGPRCVVLDVDMLGESRALRAASTMLQIDRRGRLGLHRPGAQDAASRLEPEEFLRHLASDVGLPNQAAG